MGVRTEENQVEGSHPVGGRGAGEPFAPLRRVNISGDLDDLLDRRPFFRTSLRGYDRLQVDNYATWVEGELIAVRRQSNHLLTRYGQCAAELEQLRRAAARPQRSPELTPVTERLGEMLRLAAEEAAAITTAGIDEAERIVSEAHAQAQARLSNVERIREAAVAAGEEVRRERSEAAGVLARARAQAAQLLEEAAAARDRLESEADERRAEVQADVDDLRRQRDEARESLNRLTARINEALQAAASAASGPSADIAVLADRREPVATSAS